MIWDFLMVVGGLAVLLVSGDLLVRGSVATANRLAIPPLIVGLTVVAFGTSAPELFVSLQAVFTSADAAGIALGNVVGSNIANVLLVLGVPALIYPICCNQTSIRRNTIVMLAASVAFIVLCLNGWIGLFEGAVLVAALLVFLGYSFMEARKAQARGEESEIEQELAEIDGLPKSVAMTVAYVAAALVGLPLGANFTVMGAVDIAEVFAVSPAVIGLTVIALGTSLPELATTVAAAMHRQSAVALGNVIGSNLFNILGIMGITALASPVMIEVEPRFFMIDLWVMLAASLAILPFVLARAKIGRAVGVLFLLAYGAYIYWLLTHTGAG